MEEKKEFPVLVNFRTEADLRRRADVLVQNYKTVLKPILLNFGLLDDELIRKYLDCDSMEEVYRDLESKHPERVSYLEAERINRGADVWREIRLPGSGIQSPREPGFKFGSLFHLSEGRERGIVLKSVTVKGGDIVIDYSVLEEASIIQPTEEQREVYGLVADFCNELRKRNLQRKDILELFCVINGEIRPNAAGIVNRRFRASEIRKK